jgi:hypothetical protein
MAVTRINNNQVTDASPGNVYVGINAGTKLQAYSITATRIANNLTYGSDLTITGNLTVSGTTTNVDTVNTLIQDPLITLADGQVTGTPVLDIGTIGLRGSQNSAVLAWKESEKSFVTALSNTTVSNTTFNISSYANLQTGNATVQGTTSLVGNLIGAVNATATITGGNLATPGTVSAAGNITGGNLVTSGAISGLSVAVTSFINAGTVISAVGNITGANIFTAGNVSATGNGTFGNISTAGSFSAASLSASGNITGGNLLTGGLISAGGNVSAGNVSGTNLTGTNVSVTGTATAASTVGGVITGSSSSVTGTQTAASTVGGVITGSSSSVTGTQTAASTVGGVITGSSSSVTGTQTAASTVGGTITGLSVDVTAFVYAGTIVSAAGNITGANVFTAGNVSATGNVTGGNVITDYIYSTGNTTLTINAQTISLNPTGNVGMNSRWINNLADPVGDQDAATKVYVDTVAQGLDPKASVVYATTANIAPYTYNNGTSGVGATITLTATGNLTLDGNVVTANSRVLIKNEVGAFVNNTTQSAAFNGIYVVTTAGAPGVAAVLTRSTDFNQPAEIPGAFTFVEAGTVNADTGWVCTTNSPVTVGTTQIIFTQFSGAGSYTAGTALSLTGTQFNVLYDTSGNATIGVNGSNQLYIPAGAILTTPNIGAATGTSVSVTGTVTAASTVGGVITGSSVSVTGTATAASTVGGVITGSSTSVTGTQTAASTVGGVITGSSSSVTGTQTAASTVGGVITGSSSSVTGTQTAASTVGGVITGSSSSVTGTQTAASTVGGVITGSSSSVTGTQTAASTVGGVITGSSVSVTGNVDGGNVQTSGLISATGTATVGNLATSGTVSATGNATAGNILTGGLVSATGNATAGNILTGGVASATGGVTGGNIVISGNTVNMLNPGGTIQVNSGNANTNFSVSGTSANVFFINATANTASFGSSTQTVNAIVAFNSTNSILLPAGTQGQRPATGVTGMLRFNSTTNSIEIYNNSAWIGVGSTVFTVITDQQFNGDGATTAFTLGNSSTTAATIVSINGVLQIPTSAYSVSGVTLTFTEAPATGDLIDVRALTTTTTLLSLTNVSANASVGVSDTTNIVTITGTANVVGDLTVTGNATILGNVATNQINNGNSAVQIPISSGNVNIDVGAVDNMSVFTTTALNIAGNILPQANITYNLGSTTQRWKDLWLSNSTIYLGNAQISANATSIIMTNPAGGQTVLAGATTSSSVAGNITGGNILTGGIVSAVGNIITGTNVGSPGWIGVGTATPDAEITILANPQTSTYTLTGSSTTLGTDLHIVGADATQTRITQDTFGTAAYVAFTGRAARGTAASPTQTQSADTIAQFTGRGFSGGTLQFGNASTGRVDVVAAEAFTDTSRATNVAIFTTATNSITPTAIAAFSSASGLSVAGNVTGTGNISGSYILGNGSQLTGIDATQIVSGTSNAKVVSSGGNVTVSVGGTSNVAVFSTGGVTLGTGNVTLGNIINANGNAVGNIGSSANYFNTVFAKATSAQYADLAEKYIADAEYAPGTVVIFGGTAEVTVNAVAGDTKVAGVVSTNPSYTMNSGLEAEHVATVALTGRVPTLVIGPVRKGDLMVAAGLGRAQSSVDPKVGSVIGKALEDFDGVEGTIEVVVGRF